MVFDSGALIQGVGHAVYTQTFAMCKSRRKGLEFDIIYIEVPQQCSPVICCVRLAGHLGMQWTDAVAVAVATAQTAGTDGPGRTP